MTTALQEKAPNRLLDLADLEQPPFHRILDDMDHLASTHPRLYLHPSKRWEYPWALQQAQLSQDHRVLDLGCGESVFPLYLSRNCREVVAMDWNAPRASHEATGDNAEHLCGDMSSLPFALKSFDRVFCISAIEHLDRNVVPKTLSEIHRVLRPGGKLLLTTDYYEDAAATLMYSGPGPQFKVDWGFFDEELLRKYLLEIPGFQLEGELDLSVDWHTTRSRMTRFHGYPYTSVGLVLRKKSG